jgi:hypothetical protein
MTENLLEDLADHAKWLRGGGDEEADGAPDPFGPVTEVVSSVSDVITG